LALAILFSPETLVLGLIVAGDTKVPRLAAFAYALGGILGIAFATGVGLWIAHASGTATHTPHHGWPSFAKAQRKPGKGWAALVRRFPSLDLKADLPVSRRVTRAGVAGFAMCGLHPKVFPIAIAAGHQIVQIARPGERALGVVIFAVISVIPALLPAVIDVVKPGATVGIKESYERIMKVHGRWIGALLLLGAGAFVGFDAWRDMPGR
jgi:hypothetical protein